MMNILHIIMILIHLNLNIILEISYNNMHISHVNFYIKHGHLCI